MESPLDPTELIIEKIEERMNEVMHSMIGYGDDYKSASRDVLQDARHLLLSELALVRDRGSHQHWMKKIGTVPSERLYCNWMTICRRLVISLITC